MRQHSQPHSRGPAGLDPGGNGSLDFPGLGTRGRASRAGRHTQGWQMPELRKDPVVGRWVIISTERSRRPTNFHSENPTIAQTFSPFAEGREDMTPPEVYAVRPPGGKANGPGWSVRVVPNKFPALQIEGQLERRGEGLYDKMNGIGAHEVVIEGPD